MKKTKKWRVKGNRKQNKYEENGEEKKWNREIKE